MPKNGKVAAAWKSAILLPFDLGKARLQLHPNLCYRERKLGVAVRAIGTRACLDFRQCRNGDGSVKIRQRRHFVAMLVKKQQNLHCRPVTRSMSNHETASLRKVPDTSNGDVYAMLLVRMKVR